MSTNFVIPYLNSKAPWIRLVVRIELVMIIMILTAYGNKGIPIPMVEGISFVDAGVQFGTVW